MIHITMYGLQAIIPPLESYEQFCDPEKEVLKLTSNLSKLKKDIRTEISNLTGVNFDQVFCSFVLEIELLFEAMRKEADNRITLHIETNDKEIGNLSWKSQVSMNLEKLFPGIPVITI